jgi:DNA-binding transcriptional ArsR family regulator
MMIAIEEATERTAQLQRLTKRMGVFVEPMRLYIIRALLEHGAMNVKQLTEVISAEVGRVPSSTVSRHLKILLDAQVVSVSGRGPSHFYAIEQTAIREALGDLLAYTGLPQ